MKLTVDAKGRTAIIPLYGAECLPPMIEFQGERFVRKDELHVTVAGSRDQHDGAALREAGRGLAFKIKPTGAYRLVKKGSARSLIEMVTVDALESYCARLGAALPPAHVTLFTEPGGRGIALYCAAELESLSKPADLKLDQSPWRLDEDGAILGA